MRDKALELAYEAHGRYLDADSATSGPIEDYIAEAIRRAVAELEAERDRLREALLEQRQAWEATRRVALANNDADYALNRIEEIDAALAASEQGEGK